MASSKISALTEKTSLAANDLFVIVDSVGGANKKIKASNTVSLSQTPWASNINGGGFSLSNVFDITALGDLIGGSVTAPSIATDSVDEITPGNGVLFPSGLKVATIDELVGGAKVAFGQGLKTTFITDNGFALLINTTNGQLILQDTSGAGVLIQDDPIGIGGVSVLANGVINISAIGTLSIGGSTIDAASTGGTISLTPSTGFSVCTGTEDKGGFDSDNAIFTAGALKDLAQAVAALWNSQFTKGYIKA